LSWLNVDQECTHQTFCVLGALICHSVIAQPAPHISCRAQQERPSAAPALVSFPDHFSPHGKTFSRVAKNGLGTFSRVAKNGLGTRLLQLYPFQFHRHRYEYLYLWLRGMRTAYRGSRNFGSLRSARKNAITLNHVLLTSEQFKIRSFNRVSSH